VLQQYNITFIGSGNLGSHLAIRLHRAGFRLSQIFSKDIINAKRTALQVKAGAISNLNQLNNDADIYFVCVKDDAIPEIASHIRLNEKIIAHTSASVPAEVLQQCSVNYGVFYPLQSFSKDIEPDFRHIPVFIEGSNGKVKQILTEAAKTISETVYEADEQKRLALHVAAVFANNFPNYFFAIAEKIVKKEGWSLKVLLPLINETVRKIQSNSPADMQTGPAIRGDEATVQKHLHYLADEKSLRQLYELLTNNISQLKK